MTTIQRIVIIGATSAMAEHCARLWINQKTIDLVLIGRDSQKLKSLTQDLNVRNPRSKIHYKECKFENPIAIEALVSSLEKEAPTDLVLIAHGTLPDQTACQKDLTLAAKTLSINGISPVLFAEAFAKYFEQRNQGTLAIISSVAGDRGRKSNYCYGAAKGLVTRYAQGLQHRFAKSGVNIILIKPGPTHTPMTAQLDPNKKFASVESVAKSIVSSIDRGCQTVYVPGKWFVIMMIIRHLPFRIFKYMNI